MLVLCLGLPCKNHDGTGMYHLFFLRLFILFRYVTWEIAPGRLLNRFIVDVWSKSDAVLWDMPGTGAPCRSNARAGCVIFLEGTKSYESKRQLRNCFSG